MFQTTNQITITSQKKKHYYITTIWLFNIAMDNPPIFNNGKPSISMGNLYHGYVSHNQRVFID